MKLLIHAAAFLLFCQMTHAAYLGLGLEMTNEGAVVKDLVEGGPSAKAGLQNGDLLVEIEGKKTARKDMPDIVRGILAAEEGTALKVAYRRAGKRHDAEIILGKRPARAPIPAPDGPVDPVPPPNKWLGKKLPDFQLDDWYQLPQGKKTIEPKDLEGRIIALFVFSESDGETESQGMGLFQTVAREMKGRANALPIAIHIAPNDSREGSAKSALRELRKHELHYVPMAQVVADADGSTAIADQLDLPGVPYLMLVNSAGVVRLAERSTHPAVVLFKLQEFGLFGERAPAQK